MILDGFGLVAGAIGLGLLHGVEPGHGWPVAASYALDRSNKWLYGFAASLILGIGHLLSSIAMVALFFWAKAYFDLTQIGWMNYVAGGLLIALGVREYFWGHSHHHDSHGNEDHHDHVHTVELHTHDESQDDDYAHDHVDLGHSHGQHDHQHSHDHSHLHGHSHDQGLLGRLKAALPFVGGHNHASADEASERGLWGIAAFAFVLGFAHEEEFEIIAICMGSDRCLELMAIYAVTVIFGIVALTLALIAGYEHYEERVERYAHHLPTFSAVVLVAMGVGFLLEIF